MYKEIILDENTSTIVQESAGQTILALHQYNDHVVLTPKNIIKLLEVLREYFPGEIAIGLGT